MKTHLGIFVVIFAALTWPADAEHLLATLTLEQLQATEMPEGVQIESKLVDGLPTATITNTNESAISVQLAEIPLAGFDGTRLSYEANLAPENAAKPAYLELWVVVKGEAYFSRALNDTFTGTQPARSTSTPFFLNGGEPAEAARLGIRFEGPGSVTMSGIELWEREKIMGPGIWGGILGGIVGVSAGIWACVASYCVSRGRARGAVLGVTATVALLGLVALLYGAFAWFRGAEWELWYTCAMLGGIVAIVEAGAYFSLRSRYQQSEERRMLAMDMK